MRIRITHQKITLSLQLILLAEAGFAVWSQQWLTAFLSVAIILATLLPLVIERRFRIYIPPQFQLLAIVFVFAALFLGEIHGYYTRFWWWDIALHTTSGFLLGIVGFLLVHVLNETENLDIHMKPGFVAFFAFLFALGFGALWEIFEFAMDSLAGMNMQKAMLGDPSGLTDTMWDLIVDALGALVISVLGFRYLKQGHRQSFLERWIRIFVEHNPRFFVRDEDKEENRG
ncbi:hypothetical protein [Marinobacter sp.]|uniref:hypothetical protein n=1 Tax=Marinobacter sp. TaxID=50741 RepID=UPI00384E20B7